MSCLDINIILLNNINIIIFYFIIVLMEVTRKMFLIDILYNNSI